MHDVETRMPKRTSQILVIAVTLLATSGCALAPWSNSPPVGGLRDDVSIPAQKFDAQLSLARLGERHGDIEQAKNIYEAILAKDFKNSLAHQRLGVIAASNRQMKLANYHFHEALACGAPSPDLLSDYGYLLYLQQRSGEAEEKLREAIAQDPINKAARNNLGLVLGEQGRFQESFAQFQMAGDIASAHANLAYVYSLEGKLDLAEQEYHRALAINGDLRHAAEALLQLASRPDRQDMPRADVATVGYQRQPMASGTSNIDRPTSNFEHAPGLAPGTVASQPSTLDVRNSNYDLREAPLPAAHDPARPRETLAGLHGQSRPAPGPLEQPGDVVTLPPPALMQSVTPLVPARNAVDQGPHAGAARLQMRVGQSDRAAVTPQLSAQSPPAAEMQFRTAASPAIRSAANPTSADRPTNPIAADPSAAEIRFASDAPEQSTSPIDRSRVIDNGGDRPKETRDVTTRMADRSSVFATPTSSSTSPWTWQPSFATQPQAAGNGASHPSANPAHPVRP
jgi:Tfp pilus assembly protein PilF